MKRTGSPRPDTLFSVRVNGAVSPLPEADHARLLRAVVDHRLHAPTMIELTFLDDSGDFLSRSGITFGTAIEVRTVAVDDRPAMYLGSGEVTALEGDYYDLSMVTVVRAYDQGHRLQRRSRTRTFVNMTDAEIARRIVREVGLRPGRIEPTRARHTHLAQMNQTDWDFLSWRCRETGFEFGFDEGSFYFRPATSTSAASPAATLELQRNLRSFRPRVTAANLADSAEVRVWDPLRAEVVSVVGPVTEETVRLTGASATAAADAVDTGVRTQPPRAATGSFGPAPAQGARVLGDTAPAQGVALGAASQEALHGTLRHMADSFAEAQASAWGDPALRAGATVRVTSAPAPFSGLWTVAAAQHMYDVSDRAYITRLQLGTARDRTFAALASRGSEAPAPRVAGLLCGIVTDVNDPTGTGRVKLAMPLLSPDLETDWAPVAQPAGGRRAGALLLPEVGDQVLVGFELGDTRRPYVVGGVLGTASHYRLGGPAVEATGASADVVRRGIVSPSGNMLAFHDRMPADGRPPTASEIVLGTADGSLGLAVDQVAGTVTVSCRPHPPLSRAGAGSLVIECGDAGNIDIRAGQGGRVTVDGGSSLRLTARESVHIESSGTVAVKGSRIELN
ncbi:VgrG-related protein [Streptomyces sp. NPDC001288]|uniref:VgrG-related protein n=1 Tax=Streptomyces sp. NPDC001297 TaxID=3364559 RepID=UPI0036BC101D